MSSTKYIDSKISEYEKFYQKELQAFNRYDHQQLTAHQLILIQNEALDQARLRYLDLANEYRQLLLERGIENQETLQDVLKTVERYEMDRENSR